MPIRLTHAALVSRLLIAVISVAPVNAEGICLHLQAGDRSFLYPVNLATGFRISFLHSIYGTAVQEQFRIASTGFQTEKLRYAELRLAEFYGHEAPKVEEGWWTVSDAGMARRQIA